MSPELRRLVEEVAEIAALPLGKARSLPAAAYTSEEFLQLEQELIFKKSWVCPGRLEEIPNPGDYLTYQIGEQPVVCIRQDDGSVRTFSNICLHRFSQLLEGRGNCKKIVCPYHAWTYGMDGGLQGAPFMDKATAFRPADHCLPEVRTELWKGWIYVTLSAEIQPVAERLAGFAESTRIFETEGYREVLFKDEIWETNWKCLTENFIEGYHLFRIHAETLEPSAPTRLIRCVPGDEAHCIHFAPALPESGAFCAHPSNTRVHGEDRHLNFDACIYPSHGIVGGHDVVWWISTRPISVSKTHLRWGISFAPEVLGDVKDYKKWAEEMDAFFDVVNGQDRSVLERMYRSLRGSLAKSVRLSHLEQPIWEYGRYIARAISGGTGASGGAKTQAFRQSGRNRA